MKIYYTYKKKEVEEIVEILKKVQNFCLDPNRMTMGASKISLDKAINLLLTDSEDKESDYDLD